MSIDLGMPQTPPAPLAERRLSRQIMVGSVPVGGGAPVTVQSMTTTKTADAEATLSQIYALAAAGADLVVNYREPGAIDRIKEFGFVDRVIEVALDANIGLDLAVIAPNSEIVTYASTPTDPVVPVRACMSANVTLRFVLLYGIPSPAFDQAVAGITAALAAGALTELPVHRYDLDDIVAAQDAVQAGAVGKVVVVPG